MSSSATRVDGAHPLRTSTDRCSIRSGPSISHSTEICSIKRRERQPGIVPGEDATAEISSDIVDAHAEPTALVFREPVPHPPATNDYRRFQFHEHSRPRSELARADSCNRTWNSRCPVPYAWGVQRNCPSVAQRTDCAEVLRTSGGVQGWRRETGFSSAGPSSVDLGVA